MKHKVVTRTLGRQSAHRTAMLRNLVTSLFLHRKIVTTEIRAKETAKFAARMITLAKKGDLASKRRVFSDISDRDVAATLFNEIAPRYAAGLDSREGGYTRIVHIPARKGDNAPMAVLELM